MKCWLPTFALSLLASMSAEAINQIKVSAKHVQAGTIAALNTGMTFDLHSASRSTLQLQTAQLELPATLTAQAGVVSKLHVKCQNPVIHEPLFACAALTVNANAARWPPVAIKGSASFRSDTGRLEARGSGLSIAGSPLSFAMNAQGARWHAQFDLPKLKLTELPALLSPWATLPEGLAISGTGSLQIMLNEGGIGPAASATLTLKDAGYQNADFTWIGEKIETRLRADLISTREPYQWQLALNGIHGQALAGPVLLDFDKNPLQLQLQGDVSNTALNISALVAEQKDLASATGTAQISLQPFAISNAQLTASQVHFPAAYASYLQLPLATTPFNQLVTAGTARADFSIRNNQPTQFTLKMNHLSLKDDARKLDVQGIAGEVFWSADSPGPPRPSFLAWKSSRGWGIVGAETRLDFVSDNRDFRLTKPARLPFFDGALLINTLAVQNAGLDNMTGRFDANIEPISIGPIALAFGMPEFAGKLSGRIPGLTYENKRLALQGNIEADVFDGHIVASNLSVTEPLSAWPRLHADIVARNLDLDLITRTFEFGSITGRLDADVLNLETFNWSPVSFDLRIATPRNDRSRHRISQRAVQNLSNISGGGGGVAAALQSGALKFFDEFGYARIGLSCRLRNDVCQMAGAGPADPGFYIVKGSGLPRINIIGNNERVNWPQLMTQVSDALKNPEGINVR
jgi:hypothetical protein